MKRLMVCERLLKSFAFLTLGFVLSNLSARANSPVIESSNGSSTLVSAGTAPDAQVVWHEDFDEGWRTARKSGLPMVIFITSKRCHFCDAMKRSTWCDGAVLKNVKERFVAIRLTPDRNAETLKRINVSTFPTTLIGHPEGKIVGHRLGFQPPAAMQQFLKTVGRSVH